MNNVINKRQFMILSIIILTTFKISFLPSYLATYVSNYTAYIAIGLILVDVILLIAGYYIINAGLMMNFKAKHRKIYLIVLAILAVFFSLKGALYFGEVVNFVTVFLYEKVDSYFVAIFLGVSIWLIIKKGFCGLARISELVIWGVIMIVLFNILFINVDSDVYRNLPFTMEGARASIAQTNRFIFWIGDSLPLLMVYGFSHDYYSTRGNKMKSLQHIERGSKKGRSKLVLAVVISIGIVAVMSITAIAIYGNSLVAVSNYVVRLGTYNDFARELGRFDWAGLVMWLMVAIISISSIGIAITTCLQEGVSVVYNDKSNVYSAKKVGLSAFVTTLVLVVVATNAMYSRAKMEELTSSGAEYFMLAAVVVVPFIIMIFGKGRNVDNENIQE